MRPAEERPPLTIAIAHDWLVRYAGSERVVEEMANAFPGSRILTTLVDPDRVPPTLGGAEPSLLQRIPAAASHHEALVPLMPLSWRAREPLSGVDAVVSSSHACAKAVRREPGIPHLCYCHTPMRYAWDFESEKSRFPGAVRPLARAGMAWFRRWDRASAANVTTFVANSTAVADRIRRFYGRGAQVIHPPVRTSFFTPGGIRRSDRFLYVGRLTGYKQADLVVDAFANLDAELVVVGEGTQRRALEGRAASNVRFAGTVDDEELRELYRSCAALVYPAEEDFGIVMAEAQACGAPVIGYRRGGAADIVEDGATGFLLERQDVGALRRAVARVASDELDEAVIRASAERFSAARFRERIRSAVEEMVSAAGHRAASA